MPTPATALRSMTAAAVLTLLPLVLTHAASWPSLPAPTPTSASAAFTVGVSAGLA